jgi:hypothetical protein
MTVAICNVCLEYDHCTVKETHGNVLNNTVKVTKGLGIRWSSLTQPSELCRTLAGVKEGKLTIALG